MGNEFLKLAPEYDRIPAVKNWEGYTESYMEELWDEFFGNYYQFAKNKDVMSGGDYNYFIYSFKEQFKNFEKSILQQKVSELNAAIDKHTIFEGNSITEAGETTYKELLSCVNENNRKRARKQLLLDWNDFLAGKRRADWEDHLENISSANDSRKEDWEDFVLCAIGVEYKKVTSENNASLWSATGRIFYDKEEIDRINGLEDRKIEIYYERKIDFLIRSKNVFVWIFKILQKTMNTLEDFIFSKTSAIQVPQKAVEKATDLLKTDEEADFVIPDKSEDPGDYNYIPGTVFKVIGEGIETMVGSHNTPDKIAAWNAQHHNSVAKAYRDEIRSYRDASQKKIGENATKGAVINTAITDQANLLKAVSKISSTLIRSIISKK